MLPIFKIYIDDEVEGVQKISLVHSPAVESDFLCFDEQAPSQPFKFETDEEQRIVFGCAIRADYPIYRRDKERGEYYVVFDKQSIKDINERFAKENNFNKVNLDHSEDTDGVYMTQMFIKDVENGINPKNFEDIEDGSLFTAYKVENDDVWEAAKNGEFKGFSVEGVFRLLEVPTEQKMEEVEEDEIDKIINELLK